MARKRKQDATPPLFELELAKEPRHFDEANVARLGLISIQERIPEGYASWEEEFEVLGKPVKLACYANPNVGGVPHGLDNEVSLALIALYLNAGSPPTAPSPPRPTRSSSSWASTPRGTTTGP